MLTDVAPRDRPDAALLRKQRNWAQIIRWRKCPWAATVSSSGGRIIDDSMINPPGICVMWRQKPPPRRQEDILTPYD